MPRSSVSRRRFLRQVAAGVAVGPLLSGRAYSFGPNEQVGIACIGVGGKGESDMAETAAGHRIVAVCDVDSERLARAAAMFPDATALTDWRHVLDLPGIDAVTVSTPDHMHAPISMSAMQRGYHCFTQKPLTNTVYESRRLAEVAAEKGLVTQMGIQNRATARLKMAVQTIRDGVIGKVREVHAWTDRPGNYWRQGLSSPTTSDQPPESLNWDHWLGVAPQRSFVAGLYHPFHWRGWWDFGTGALGDMGCHILDPVVNALELGPPRMVRAEGPPPHADSGPLECVVHYEFPGTAHTAGDLKLTWYEAGKQPPREIFLAPADWPGSLNGVLYVGEKGNLFLGFPEMPELFPKGEFAEGAIQPQEEHNHYTEWTTAIATGGTTSAPFSYSGPLTETVLLGNVTYRSGNTIEWDSANLKAIGSPEADAFIRRSYRAGWEVEGLS
jgi:predicted dehydrogenase